MHQSQQIEKAMIENAGKLNMEAKNVKKIVGIEGKLNEGGEKTSWKRRERYYPKYFPISARRNDWREC
jgi:hypothetical protein